MRRKLSKWHRRIGLTSLGLLSWLAVTGVLLNHAEGFGFNTPIGVPFVAKIYGIQARCEIQAWSLNDQTLIDCGATILLDGKALTRVTGPLIGAQTGQGLSFIANAKGLLLLTSEGQQVEWIPADLLPGRPLRLGQIGPTQDQGQDGAIVLQTPAGIFSSDRELSRWQSQPSDAAITWALAHTLKVSEREHAQALAAVRQLSWSKVLQDLHSGRIIGVTGRVLADLGALSMLLLAFLGLFMSSNLSRKRRTTPAKAPADAKRDDTPSA